MKNGTDLARDLLTMGSGRITNYFAHQFLTAADLSAKAAAEAEAKLTEFHPLSPDRAHYAHVTTAIIMSVTALEAWINEFYWDCANASPDHTKGMAEVNRARLGKLWSSNDLGLERLSILDKYFVALDVGLDKSAQSLGGVVECADAKTLIVLRNALIHFKPEVVQFDAQTARERNEWPRLERSLERKFAENPHAAGMPFFPHRCISAGCAAWAVTTASRFIELFQAQGGFTRPKVSAVMEYV